MAFSASIVMLVAAITLAVFLSLLNFSFWIIQRKDSTSFWSAAWLFGSAIYTICRLLQYSPLDETLYNLIPRILLTMSFIQVCLGYELGNSFIRHRSPRWERPLIFALVSIPLCLLWFSNLILTDQHILRTTIFEEVFHGVLTGVLYSPASIIIFMIGIIPVARLVMASNSHRRENFMLASGFSFVILFSLNDFIATALNARWIRLSDYCYLPLAIFISYIQIERYGLLYRNMDIMTGEQTKDLTNANETLRAEISERKKAEKEQLRQLQELQTLNTVATAGAESKGIDELIERVTAAVGEVLYPDNFGVLLVDENPQMWRPHASYQGIGAQDLAKIYPLSEGIAGKVISSAKAIRVNDIRQEAYFIETTSGVLSEIAAPILIDGKVFGCLNAESRQLGAFSEKDERLLNTIAESMATAIQRILLIQTEKRRREIAEVLFNTTHDLVIQPNLLSLLRIIVERAADLLNTSGGGMYLCNPEKRQVRCVVSHNLPRDFTGVTLKYGEGSAGKIAETGQPLIIDDYRIWDGRSMAYELERPFVSMLSVPMCWQGRVLGIIHVIENNSPRKFNHDDLQILTLFANQAAVAVENARLMEFEQRRSREALAMAEVDRDISASLQLEIVLERIASHAQHLLHTDTSAVYIADIEKGLLHAVAAIGPDAREIKQDALTIGKGILGNIALQRKGEIVNDSASDPRAITIIGTDDIYDEHLLGVPILSKDKLTGLIAVWRIGPDNEFNITDLDFLSSLAQQAAVAIENARLFDAERIRRQEAETLRAAAQIITSTLDQKQAIEMILDQLFKVVPYASASIQLLRDGYLEVIGGRGWADNSNFVGLRFPVPGDNPNTFVVQNRRSLILENILDEYSMFKDSPHQLVQSWLGVPLIVRDRVIGMFSLDHTQRNFFTDSDVPVVSAFAAQAAIAIENTRLFEDTRQRLAELEILQTIASALRVADTPDETFPIILAQLINLLNFDSALVDLIDPSSGEIVSGFGHGVWMPFNGLRTPINVGGSGRVIATGKPYITSNAIVDGIVARPDMLAGVLAAACIPITSYKQTIGTLWVGRQGSSPITQEEINLLVALGEMAGNTVQRMKLHEQTVRQAEEIALAYDLTLEGWAKALELRDKETEGHSRRVTTFTLKLASCFGISNEEMPHVRRGVLLHDIGKMGVPDHILKNNGALSEEEWKVMHNHPRYAYDLLKPIAYLHPALDIPYCHHEKWDGTGYPNGLKGEEIPLTARIFAVVDVWDALTSDRPYRAAWTAEKTYAYIKSQSGTHFDPRVVEQFLKLLDSGALEESV